MRLFFKFVKLLRADIMTTRPERHKDLATPLPPNTNTAFSLQKPLGQ